MAPKRSRSESGPQLVWRRVRGRMESGALTWNAIQSEPVQVVSRAVRALLELPDTIVAEILRLVDTGRYLEDFGQWLPSGFGQSAVYGQWAGTRRMVNRQYLVDRFWKPSSAGPTRYADSYMDHLFTLQFPQPLVY